MGKGKKEKKEKRYVYGWHQKKEARIETKGARRESVMPSARSNSFFFGKVIEKYSIAITM